MAIEGGARAAYTHAFAAILHSVFLTAVPIALAAFVLSWFLREINLRRTAAHDSLSFLAGGVWSEPRR